MASTMSDSSRRAAGYAPPRPRGPVDDASSHDEHSRSDGVPPVRTAAEAVTLPLWWMRPTNFGNRWLALLLVTRLLSTGVAVGLLAAHNVTRFDGALIVVTIAYGIGSLLVFARWPQLQDLWVTWLIDTAAVLALVLVSDEWRSPFYLLAITSLILPVTSLPFRRAIAWGTLFMLAYLVIAAFAGLDIQALKQTTRLESLTTHLLIPFVVTLALAYASDLLARLNEAQERSQRLAVETERKRIAWELHDSAKQRVHAAHLVLSAVQQGVDPAQRPTIDHAMAELQLAVTDMETSLSELRTPLLDGRQLGAALRERGQELSRVTDARIKVSGDAQRLPPFMAAHAYRIASEAMTNAVRHAEADKIEVRVRTSNGHLTITVTDDGRGMPGDVRPGSHGMRAMRSRARTLGGELQIQSGKDGGTTVKLDVPLTTAEGAPT
jgi:signal transduction histidine kinase